MHVIELNDRDRAALRAALDMLRDSLAAGAIVDRLPAGYAIEDADKLRARLGGAPDSGPEPVRAGDMNESARDRLPGAAPAGSLGSTGRTAGDKSTR